MNRKFLCTARALGVAAMVLAAPLAFGQNTIKIGMITDRVGPAKG